MKSGKWNSWTLVALFLWLVVAGQSIAGERVFYLKADTRAMVEEDGELVGPSETFLKKGEELRCEMNKEGKRCCFEDEEGKLCVPADKLATSPVSTRDLKIVGFLYSARKGVDACASGKKGERVTDALASNYGLLVDGDVKGKVLIMGNYRIRKNDMELGYPTLSKAWIFNVNSTHCYNVEISKTDVDGFLQKYRDVASFLSVEKDLNIPVTALFQVVSTIQENTYKNNSLEVKTILPADSAEIWGDSP